MSESKKKILITGASIAGPCAAFWLSRQGFEVTVVERAPRFRTGGQNIDIRGPGQTVIDLMGLRVEIEKATTGELGLEFIGADGQTTARFPRHGGTSFTSDIEILRGDLARIFVEATEPAVEYRYGRHVTAVEDREDGVTVTFDDAEQEDYWLLINAEGIGSKTRSLVFGDEAAIDFLGVYTSYFFVPREEGDTDWAQWYNAEGGRMVILRPGTPDSLSASFNFHTNERGLEKLDADTQKKMVQDLLRDAGWKCARLAEHVSEDDDFYFGALSQVKAPRWSKGHCVMIGDAAHCPSPLTGMGTTLAIVGSYVLAGELSRKPLAEALASYEKIMRPYVEETQKLPPGVPRLAYPKSRLGVRALNTAVAAAASRPVQSVMSAFSKRPASRESFELPEYA